MIVFHNYSVFDFLWPPHHGLLLHLLHVTEESHGGIHTDDTIDKIDVNISIDGCDKEYDCVFLSYNVSYLYAAYNVLFLCVYKVSYLCAMYNVSYLYASYNVSYVCILCLIFMRHIMLFFCALYIICLIQ